jgi:hypothetical protein
MTAATELARMAADLKQLITKFSFDSQRPGGNETTEREPPHHRASAPRPTSQSAN